MLTYFTYTHTHRNTDTHTDIHAHKTKGKSLLITTVFFKDQIIIIIISGKLSFAIKFIKLFCYVLSVCRLCSDALSSILDTRDVFLSLITLAKAEWVLLRIARNRHVVLLIVTILSLHSI